MPIRSGTGFFISPDYLITNEHVVHNGCKQIILQERKKDWATAQIIAVDAVHDLALLRAAQPWPNDTAILRKDIEALKEGDAVVAVGFTSDTLSEGKDYEIAQAHILNADNSYDNPGLLQFSHSVQQGYSGGPLLDENKKVVGVVKGVSQLYQTDIVNGVAGEKHLVNEADEAIKLSALEEFLTSNQAPFYTANDKDETNNGLDFIANVQCEYPVGE